MKNASEFKDVLILGGGYSAHLAAIALDPVLPVRAIVAPKTQGGGQGMPDGLSGQHAHSHIFLPRLEREIQRIDPDLLPRMAAHGLRFVPGSYRLGDDAPEASRRLFATRWQFDAMIEALFQERIEAPRRDASIREAQLSGGAIQALTLAEGKQMDVPDTTLVLDAMGTKSPVMATLARGAEGIIDEAGDVAYITQFFHRSVAPARPLPDPLIDCPHDFGAVAVMLYPGAEGWFSISMAVDTRHKELVREMRQPETFLDFCRKNPNVAAWIDGASVEGPNRIYINPRNRWNVGLFEGGTAPANYLAVGDALTTMLPTLGANCSFAATHIRIVRDLLVEDIGDYPAAFAKAVTDAQFPFFQRALTRKPPADGVTPFEQSREQRPLKRVKRGIRRALGLDRRRIITHLAASSSL